MQVLTAENAQAFYAQKLNLDDVQEAAEKIEKALKPKTEAAEEESDEPDEVKDDKEEAKEEPAKKKGTLNTRFRELTDAKKAEKLRADAAEARANALEAKEREREQAAQAKEEEKSAKPKPADYQDAYQYAEDLAEWKAQEAIRAYEKKQGEAAANRERQKVVDTFKTRMEKAAAEIPDFQEMLDSASDLKVGDDIRDAIIESDLGPNILYHLAANPEVVDKLNGLRPAAALRELGKLEAKLEAEAAAEAEPEVEEEEKPVKKRPPAPVKPLRSKAPSNPLAGDEFTGTYAEYKAARQSGKG